MNRTGTRPATVPLAGPSSRVALSLFPVSSIRCRQMSRGWICPEGSLPGIFLRGQLRRFPPISYLSRRVCARHAAGRRADHGRAKPTTLGSRLPRRSPFCQKCAILAGSPDKSSSGRTVARPGKSCRPRRLDNRFSIVRRGTKASPLQAQGNGGGQGRSAGSSNKSSARLKRCRKGAFFYLDQS